MIRLQRLLSATLVASLLASLAPAQAAQQFSPLAPTATGSFLAGEAALREMRTGAAASYLRDALEGEYDHPRVVQSAIIAFAADGRLTQAADTARHMLEVDPGNALALLVIASEDFRQSRYDQAIDVLKDMPPETFAGAAGAIVRAWSHIALGNYDEAMKSLDAVSANGFEDFLLFHRGLMADFAGRHDEALDIMSRAYENDPGVARIVEAYTRMLGNRGRFDEALRVLDAYAAEGIGSPAVTMVRDAIVARRAPGPFTATVQAGAAEMFFGIGIVLVRDRNPELALMILRMGLTIDPHADMIAMLLGQYLDEGGNHEGANQIYNAIAAGSPMKPTAVVRVARNFDALGDREEALRRLNNIVVADPSDVDALSVLADLQRADEQFAEAAKTYGRIIDLKPGDEPGDWSIYFGRGISYDRSKDWEKAEADFRKALELRPDQPQVLNYLGYSWVDKGMNLNEALHLIEKAVAAAPDDAYILDSLGWAYYRLGRYEEAVTTLEQAVQMKPADAELNDHLGDAYWRVGRKLEARFQYNIALSVDEDGNVTKRIEKKLASPQQGPVDDPVVPAAATVPPESGTPAQGTGRADASSS